MPKLLLPLFVTPIFVICSVAAEKQMAGELIALDHINREGVLRIDRYDDQRRTQWDRPHPFILQADARVMYHGAPAELRDIPIGTHLHGVFHEGPEVRQYAAHYVPVLAGSDRRGPYLAFSRVSMLEDDFSRDVRLKRLWRVDTCDITAGKLTVTGLDADGGPHASATILDIGPEARIWKHKALASLSDIQPGMKVLANLTICTLFGPGRVVELWLDDESRAAATAHQLEVHRRYQRTRGVPGRIEKVDNELGSVTVTVFPSVAPKLLEDFTAIGITRIAPAEESLRTWWPINDRQSGPSIAHRAADGTLSVTVTVSKGRMVEGFRPGRVVRLWPGDGQVLNSWPLMDAPREESLLER
jgi:hypothetical protein